MTCARSIIVHSKYPQDHATDEKYHKGQGCHGAAMTAGVALLTKFGLPVAFFAMDMWCRAENTADVLRYGFFRR